LLQKDTKVLLRIREGNPPIPTTLWPRILSGSTPTDYQSFYTNFAKLGIEGCVAMCVLKPE
jgi:hypothetical protein